MENDQNFISDIMRFLDNVLTDFIENAPEQFSNAKYSAMKERSVGLGVMGLHSFFQQKNIPLESVMSKVWNKKIFKNISKKKLMSLQKSLPKKEERALMQQIMVLMKDFLIRQLLLPQLQYQ